MRGWSLPQVGTSSPDQFDIVSVLLQTCGRSNRASVIAGGWKRRVNNKTHRFVSDPWSFFNNQTGSAASSDSRIKNSSPNVTSKGSISRTFCLHWLRNPKAFAESAALWFVMGWLVGGGWGGGVMWSMYPSAVQHIQCACDGLKSVCHSTNNANSKCSATRKQLIM